MNHRQPFSKVASSNGIQNPIIEFGSVCKYVASWCGFTACQIKICKLGIVRHFTYYLRIDYLHHQFQDSYRCTCSVARLAVWSPIFGKHRAHDCPMWLHEMLDDANANHDQPATFIYFSIKLWCTNSIVAFESVVIIPYSTQPMDQPVDFCPHLMHLLRRNTKSYCSNSKSNHRDLGPVPLLVP